MARGGAPKLTEHFLDSRLKPSARKTVVAKSPNQRRYIDAMRENDLVFGVGPAGTGKTYLAVAMAISLLNEKRIQRILLCRPAVEAGEKLGFLPGDIAAKVDPYLRPLYDALHDMLEPERIEQLVERGTIEVAPLAFMRGRTLNDAFIILDEAQNTTPEQMKMFLTRIGRLEGRRHRRRDPDRPPASEPPGWWSARGRLGHPGIAIVHFDKTDVVRHPLVQRIVVAYAERDARIKGMRANEAARSGRDGRGGAPPLSARREMGPPVPRGAAQVSGAGPRRNLAWSVGFLGIVTVLLASQRCGSSCPRLAAGEPAPYDVRAIEDVDVPDEIATGERRAAARALVPDIYVHDTQKASTLEKAFAVELDAGEPLPAAERQLLVGWLRDVMQGLVIANKPMLLREKTITVLHTPSLREAVRDFAPSWISGRPQRRGAARGPLATIAPSERAELGESSTSSTRICPRIGGDSAGPRPGRARCSP